MKLQPEEAKKALLRYLNRKRGPLLVGEAAVTLGPLCSLKEAEALLTEMVKEGTLRLAEQGERQFDSPLAYVRCK